MKRFIIALALLLLLPLAAHGASMRYYSNIPLAEVRQAIHDGQDRRWLEAGYLDVTRAPYGADRTGQADSTSAIQAAIDDAYAYNFVVRVPVGQYRISSTLVMKQIYNYRSLGGSNRKFAPQLTCERGAVLRAIDGALGTGTLVHIRFDPDDTTGPTRLYNVLFRGCDIDMGRNPDAVAIKASGAQWVSVEDVTIRGEAFAIGVDGAPGSGGSMTNITVAGGRIGWRQTVYRPTPSCQGCRLIGQSEAAIDLGGVRGGIILAGLEIRNTPLAFRVTGSGSGQPSRNLVLVDGVIDAGTVIDADGSSIYAKDVFARAGNGTFMINFNPAQTITRQGWQRVDELACADDGQGNNSAMWLSGQVTSPDACVSAMTPVASPPPVEPLLRKHAWEPHTLPTWFDGGTLDVRTFGATPALSSDDDAPALMSAFRASRDQGRCAFLGRGWYHVRQTVEIPAGACVIGSSYTNSVIESSPAWVPSARTALVRTEDAPGDLWLVDFAITGHEGAASQNLTSHKHITVFHGRTGNTGMVDVQVNRREYYAGGNGHYDAPVFVLSGNAGGRFTPGCACDLFHGAAESMSADHRMILVDGTSRPIAMYQPDTEGARPAAGQPQTEIRNASNVAWYAFKWEDTGSKLLSIVGSRNVLVLGGSGNYSPANPMFQVNSSTDVAITVMARQGDAGGIMLQREGKTVAGSFKLLTAFRDGAPTLPPLPAWPAKAVEPPPAPVPTAQLSSTPATIQTGETSTLAWSSTNAEACTGGGFPTGGTTGGSVAVSPITTTTYSVSCTGLGGSASDPTTVTVLQPPTGGVTIADIVFNEGTYDRMAIGSDNWPCTWAPDDHLYCSWGDGGGFGGTNQNGRVSLGFARVEGPHDAYVGRNVWGGLSPENPAQFGGKSYGIISLGGALYSWIGLEVGTGGCGQFQLMQLYKSTDGSKTWQPTAAQIAPPNHGGAFTWPNVLNFGRDNAGARDGYVYTYWVGEKGIVNPDCWGSSNGAYLTRVPAAQVEDFSAYEFFAGLSPFGAAAWSPSIGLRRPVFTGSIHWAFNVVYIAPLRKYLLINNSNPSPSGGLSLSTRTDLEFWQADQPWGPWTLAKRFADWRAPGSSDADRYQFFFEIPTKWVSSDGLSFSFLWTGRGRFDAWNEMRGRFTIQGEPPPPPVPTADLTANPPTIQAGSSSTLAWNSTDATACTGDGFSTGGLTVGTVVVQPPQTTTYMMSCSGTGGTASDSITVTVEPPPPPACAPYRQSVEILGGVEILTGTACRNTDGTWRIQQ